MECLFSMFVYSSIAQWQSIRLLTEGLLVRAQLGELVFGILAQLGEHLPYKQRVIGSSPIGPIYLCRCGSTAEQLICNQQVIGSNPIIGFLGGFPSGQRGQTVNLLAMLSKVRILLRPLIFFRYDRPEYS